MGILIDVFFGEVELEVFSWKNFLMGVFVGVVRYNLGLLLPSPPQTVEYESWGRGREEGSEDWVF